MASRDIDRLVSDRYRLDRVIGRGGMAVVWQGEDLLLQRQVAIKEIEYPAVLPDDEREALRRRTMREAQVVAGLSHRGVVTVYDVVEEDGHTFIVMELVDAPTLSDLVAREGPLLPARAADIALDVLGALEAAHERGIVHRDVKPGNVMVEPGGRARLADFGIATVKDDPRLTASGMVLGSPAYMSPEQGQGGEADPASDLWSLGATLFYAVEGRSPFDRGKAIPTLSAVVHENPPPMEKAGALALVITALLAKEPADRPTPSRLRGLLDEVAQAAPTPAPAPSPAPTRRLTEPAAIAPPPATAKSRSRSRRTPVLAVALVVLVALGAGLVALVSRDSDNDGGDGEASEATAAAPAGWTRYRDTATGYTISRPDGWDVVHRASNRIDFRDPESGAYLRVEWTKTPGPSAEQAWRNQAPQFAAKHGDYHELGIEPTTFKGADAAEWEFTYVDGGAELHAVDLGFVIDNRWGFALNYQSHEDDWDDFQDTFERMKASFVPPS